MHSASQAAHDEDTAMSSESMRKRKIRGSTRHPNQIAAEYNVLDFGADPSGATDSYAAFSAWSSAITAAGGGTGVVPAGTYVIDRYVSRDGSGAYLSLVRDFTFTRCNGLHLRGYGAVLNLKGNVSLTRDVDLGNGLYASYGKMLSPFIVWGCTNVCVEGFEINGHADQVSQQSNIVEPGGHCVSIWGSSGVTVRNMRIHHGWSDGISVRRNNGDPISGVGAPIPHVASRQVLIENCDVFANARCNIAVHEARHVRVSNCRVYCGGVTGGTITYSPKAGIDIEPDVQPPVTDVSNQFVVIENCEVYGNGLRAIAANVRYSHVAIRGCFIDNESEDQYPVVLSVPHCSIVDCEINVRTGHIDAALTGTSPGSNVFTMERCLVRGTDSYGLLIAAQHGFISQALVANNRFINESQSPMSGRRFPSLSHGNDMLMLTVRDNYIFIPRAAYGGIGQKVVVDMHAQLVENNVYETDMSGGGNFFAVLYGPLGSGVGSTRYSGRVRYERFISPDGTGFRPGDNSNHDNRAPYADGSDGTR